MITTAPPGSFIERERKYRLTEPLASALEAQLRREGKFIRHEVQHSVMLGGDEGRVHRGTQLRLRTVDGQTSLTFKGPKRVLGLDKARREVTVLIGEGPILEILAGVGLLPTVRYIKDSLIFKYKRVLVSVDRLKGLGVFCEIECHDMTTDLDAIARSLDLSEDAYEPRGYPTLAAASR